MTMTIPAQANHCRGLALPLLLAASLAVLTGPVLAARPKAATPVDAPPLWGLGGQGV